MPAYKYSLKSGKILWYANFYCTDWKGEKKHVCKRGFKTQKEAKEYERSYIAQATGKIDMLFSDVADLYLEDCKPRMKQLTFLSAQGMIKNKPCAMFGDVKISEVTPAMIRKMQLSLIEDGYKPLYINLAIKRTSAIFNYAMTYYGLQINPCKAIKPLKNPRTKELNVWTLEEYREFISHVDDAQLHAIFDVLFFTGVRIGECLALTTNDILESRKIDINKNGYRRGGEFVVQDSPKTAKSNRKIDIPESLYRELIEYIDSLSIKKTDTIFNVPNSRVRSCMRRICEDTGIKLIRIHDIRHSHVSLLISMGYDAKLISERLGHESISITMDVYGHLYEESGKTIANGLEGLI